MKKFRKEGRAPTCLESPSLKGIRRLGVMGAAASLTFAMFAAITATAASATPLANGPGSVCTYSDPSTSSSGTAAIVVNPGDTVSISCTGLPTSLTSVAVAESSPLAGALPAGTSLTTTENVLDLAAANLSCAAASGSLACSYTVPLTYTATDAQAVCPPSQAQINAGLTNCLIAIADTSGNQYNEVQLIYTSQIATTPAAPTLSLSNANGVAGDLITVSGTGWWGAALTGSPDPTLSLPAPIATVGGTAAVSSLTVSKASYVINSTGTSGTLTPPAISGTITIPSGLTAGANNVLVDEPNTTTYAGNGTLTSLTGGQSVNVEGASSLTQEGAPSISVSPTKGGNGTTVSVTGSGFDPQGSAIGLTGLAAGGSASVNSAGDITGSMQVTSADVPGGVTITATQSALSGATLTATTPFTVAAANAGPSTTAGCGYPASTTCTATPDTLNQVITESVTGTTQGLTAYETQTGLNNPDATDVTMTTTALNGVTQVAQGRLNTVTIVDTRGTLVGWSATSILETDFLGPVSTGTSTWDHVIPGSYLSWSPNLTIPTTNGVPDGVTSEITLGSATTMGQFPVKSQSTGLSGSTGPYSGMTESTTPINLCTAPAGGGGGTYECGATMTLVVPAYVAAGTYQATLDIVVI